MTAWTVTLWGGTGKTRRYHRRRLFTYRVVAPTRADALVVAHAVHSAERSAAGRKSLFEVVQAVGRITVVEETDQPA